MRLEPAIVGAGSTISIGAGADLIINGLSRSHDIDKFAIDFIAILGGFAVAYLAILSNSGKEETVLKRLSSKRNSEQK